MANSFQRFPVNGGDSGVWGPILLAQLRDDIGAMSCKVYDDSGTLKISKGRIGIDDNTNEGIVIIDTVTTISIASVSNSNWAKIEMEISGATPVFTATNISGATDPDFIPSSFTSAYNEEKGGYYITATKRTVGLLYKDGSGNLDFVVSCLENEKYIGGKFFNINDHLIKTNKASFSYTVTLAGGGTAATGAWTTFALNTTDYNFITGVSLASNQVTLPAGKYLLKGQVNFSLTGNTSAIIWNATDSTIIVRPSTVYPGSSPGGLASAMNVVFPETYLEIGSSKLIELRYNAQLSASSLDLGDYQISLGSNIVTHRTLEIEKIDG